jgi:hypothetical protein
MNPSWLIPLTLPPILGGLGLLLRSRRRDRRHVAISEVCAQHVYLFRGGHLSESAIQTSRATLEPLLARHEIERAESCIGPGKQFAVQVRALSEINSEEARCVLEHQFDRHLSDDALEQAWYRLDLACGLRRMNRLQSLPVLVRAAAGPDGPLVHFLAAEVACFEFFNEFMQEIHTPLGRSALLVLLRALRGLRRGVEPRFVARSRMGEAVEQLWEHRLDGIDPLAIRYFAEVRRFLQRVPQTERWFGDDEAARVEFHEQVGRMSALSDALDDFLGEAVEQLLIHLPDVPLHEQSDVLSALTELRADTAEIVIPMLEANRIAAPEIAVDSLANSRDESVGPWLCDWYRRVGAIRGRAGLDASQRSALQALRRHPSPDAESLLLNASMSRDRNATMIGIGGLGWWAPIRSSEVLGRLRRGRLDRSPEIRVAAESALARLGERQALRWFRQQLAGEQADPIHRVIQVIGDEGIALLWPDLDCLADADDSNIAYHASEALEQLREDICRSAQLH